MHVWTTSTAVKDNLIKWHLKCHISSLKSSINELWKGCNLAWHHNFTHIATSKELRGLRQKLDALRVQINWTISFEVWGFRTKTHLLQRDFIFNNLFELHTFCVFNMHHSKAHHQFSTLSDFIWYFSCIQWFILS